MPRTMTERNCHPVPRGWDALRPGRDEERATCGGTADQGTGIKVRGREPPRRRLPSAIVEIRETSPAPPWHDQRAMWELHISAVELVARTVLVYAFFLAALRIFGKRELGQFTLFDLALVLLAANALQPAITGPDASIPGAAIIIVTLFLLNAAVAGVRARSRWVRRLLESAPSTIARDGRWLPRVLEREGLDDDDLDAALREHGLEVVGQVKLGVLERDGSISIVPIDAPTPGAQVTPRSPASPGLPATPVSSGEPAPPPPSRTRRRRYRNRPRD